MGVTAVPQYERWATQVAAVTALRLTPCTCVLPESNGKWGRENLLWGRGAEMRPFPAAL